MLDIITHIEDNLHSEISVQSVSQYSGYSPHHFQKMFAAVTGLSLGSYIRRRRLTKAAEKLKSSSERILDIAIDSGFESQEAFTRAFKGVFGANPNAYRKGGTDLYLQKLIAITEDLLRHLQRGGIDMQPEYKTRDEFYVVGLGKTFEREKTEEIGTLLWPTLLKRFDEIPNKLGEEKQGDFITYGVCKEMWKEEQIQDQFNYYAGVEVAKDTIAPDGMELIHIPAQKYAVFTHTGGVQDLSLTNQYIWGTWLPQSKHTLAKASDLEIYPSDFDPNDPNGVMEIWVPIESN